MSIDCRVARTWPCRPEHAFALACDAARFPAFFTGFGPIPAVRGVDVDGPLRVGTRRRVRNADGSVLDEVLTEFDPPHRHAYRLSGFRPPFAWLVRHGHATWTFAASPNGTDVEWIYRFASTHAWLAPPTRLLLRFMTAAMARCLDAMARDVAASPLPVDATP